MKKNWYYFLLALPLMLFTACGDDDSDDEAPKNADTVVINDNGTTSNGSVYTPIDDKNFYLDHVKYTVEYGHLTVSGYDDAAPNGAANIAAQVTLNGNTYAVITIDIEAFYGCTTLTSVSIPHSIIRIGDRAFSNCNSLKIITVDSRNTTYDSRENCNAIIETQTNTLIQGCQATTIPQSVKSIGSSAFYGCSSLTSISIPNGVVTLDSSAFYACTGLTSITIPDNVVRLGNWCFAGCTQLTNLTLGSSLTNIGDQVFRGCPFLTAIHIKKETPIELNNTFDPAVYLSAILYIPKGCIEAYKAAEPWSAFQNIIEE